MTAFTPEYRSPDTPTNDPAAKRSQRWRALAAVGAILAVAAVGLNAAVPTLKLNFRKEAVQPRESIFGIPTRMGPWVMIADHKMPQEVVDELGTELYVHRQYIDLRQADPALVEEYENAETKSDDLMRRLAMSAAEKSGSNGMYLHVAYYTGSVDTVPHIPDRCMLGAGFDMIARDTRMLAVPATGIDTDEGLPVSYSAFQDRSNAVGGARPVNRVAYFFHVNGDYEHDAITGVRKRLQNLFETHAYFAKIEIGTFGGEGTAAEERAMQDMTDFLTEALPEVEAILPDWDAVIGKTASADNGATAAAG
ncbi:MAG: hypothetical protein AAF561_09430 [Planctomycetota bacterium]